MLTPNIATERVQKLQLYIKSLDKELKTINVRLFVVIVLAIANLSLCGANLFRYPNQLIRVATLASAVLCGVSGVANIKHKSVVKERLNLKDLEYLAETTPQVCRQKIKDYKSSETSEMFKGVEVEILDKLAEAGLVLDSDFWLGENRYTLTRTAYQTFREKNLTVSAFQWLLYDSYLDVVPEN